MSGKNGGKRVGAGRPKGCLNKATRDIKALCAIHAPDAIRELARLSVEAESEQARVAACRELLDRGFGKPSQSLDISGTIDHKHDATDWTRPELVAFLDDAGKGGERTSAANGSSGKPH